MLFCFVSLIITCFQLVEQCEDEELMDVVLPRLTKILSAWELLLAKVLRSRPIYPTQGRWKFFFRYTGSDPRPVFILLIK